MSTPGPWAFALLALAVYRLWRLAAVDEILDRPRDWVTGLHPKIDELVVCPWCLGAWMSLGAWGAWLLSPTWAVGLAVPWALSGAVGIVRAVEHAISEINT